MGDRCNLDYSVDPCFYYSIDSFNQVIHPCGNLFIINYNIRSLNCNFDEFSVFLESLKILPDMVIFTETWLLDNNISDIDGYNGYHCNRSSNNSGPGGGVSVFLKKTLQAKIIIENMNSLPEIEYVHLRLIYKKSSCLNLIAIYRPPNPTLLSDFFDKLDSIMSIISVNNKIVLAGDLNIDGLSDSNQSQSLFDRLSIYSLKSHIILPTRPNNTNGTQIDHIWSDNEYVISAGVFSDCKITDHFPTFVILPTNVTRKTILKEFRDHSDRCINAMVDRLTNFQLFFPLLTANLDFQSKFKVFYDE